MEEKEENKHQQHRPHIFVYRICPAEEWKDAQSASALAGGQLDLSSGFIHLSTSFQVPDTLARFFAGREDLYLLKINTSKVLLPLVIEQLIVITNSCKRLAC
ncbi:hypothetical protein BDL97_11G067000 [Sphagnum fallax]|nr:hypothetical protein BDL97_11G067000 [Sphagnum fallax]